MKEYANFNKEKISVILAFILLGGFLRVLLSGVPNVTPVAALALFGGAYFRNKKLAFAFPLLVMFLSDLVLEVAFHLGLRQFSGFHNFMPFVYSGFLLVVFVGTFLQNRVRFRTVIGAGLLSSAIFFFISNFGVWIAGEAYTKDISGLIACFVNAIPFFRYTFLGDLLFIGAFFGAFELLKYKFPRLAFAN